MLIEILCIRGVAVILTFCVGVCKNLSYVE